MLGQVVRDRRSKARTVLNDPRRIRRSVIAAKNRYTWLSHDPLVGVKWGTNSGCRTSHSRTAGRLRVP